MKTLFSFSVYSLVGLTSVAYAADASLSVRDKLARAVAVVAAHEGALVSPRDLDLIWQATAYNGQTDEQRLGWLRSHSARALGSKPCVSGNCTWSADLYAGAAIPAAVASGRVSGGYWRTVTLPRFQHLLSRAKLLVNGAPYDKPCGIEPRTWGGVGRDGVDDRAVAARKFGRYPIGCAGTLNDGFAPAKAFRAAGLVPPPS